MRKLLLRFSIVVVILLATTYLFRRSLFEDWIISELRQSVASALDADLEKVEVAGLGGNWITGLEIQGLQIHGGDQCPIQHLRHGLIKLDYGIWSLLRGKASAVSRVQLHAESLQLQVVADAADEKPPEQNAEPFAWETLPELIAQLCRDGVELKVESFGFGQGEANEGKALTVTLGSAEDGRRLQIQHGSNALDSQLKGKELQITELLLDLPEINASAEGLRLPLAGPKHWQQAQGRFAILAYGMNIQGRINDGQLQSELSLPAQTLGAWQSEAMQAKVELGTSFQATTQSTMISFSLQPEMESLLAAKDFLTVKGELSLTDNLLQVQLENAPGSLRAQLSSQGEWGKDLSHRPWTGSIHLQKQILDDLPMHEQALAWLGIHDLHGSLTGEMIVKGSWENPDLQANLQLEEGSCKLPGLPRLEQASVDLKVKAQNASLQLQSTLGDAPLHVQGEMQVTDGKIWQSKSHKELQVKVQGQDLLLLRQDGLKIRGNLDLEAKGQLPDLTLGGTADLTSGKLVKRLSLLPDLRKQGGQGLNTFGPYALPGSEALNLELDVRVNSLAPMEIKTHVLDTELDLAMRLQGPGSAMRLQGTCSARQGTIRFPGSSLRIESGQLTFSRENPGNPQLLALAAGQRHGIRVSMQVQGPVDDPEVVLTSTPPLPAEELWTLITTGLPPATLAKQSTQGQATLLGGYLIQELLGAFFASESTEAEASFLERFQVEAGREVSNNGVETWQVEFDLSGLWGIPNNFSTRVERDVYEDQNLGLIYSLRF